MDPQLKLIRLQKKLTHALRKDVDRVMGKTPEPVRRYEKFYKQEFSKLHFKHVSKDSLISQLRKSDVLFTADFHTDPQSPKTALRLLRDLVKKNETWKLGLELVPSSEQKNLDLLFKKKITTATFLERVQYAENWGFPWSHYEPLIEWAIDHKVELVALDRPREILSRAPFLKATIQQKDLKDRDQWAAGIITDLFAHHRNQSKNRMRMLVLYGELHIAKPCLPYQLEKISKPYLGVALKSARIFQNHEALFWKLALKGNLHKKDVIQLSKNSFCIFSTTPWNKLQSLLSWAEGDHLAELHSPSHSHSDEDESDTLGNDWSSILKSHLNTIAEYFGTAPCKVDQIHLLTVENADFEDTLDGRLVNATERRLIRQLVDHNERFYFKNTHLMWAATPSYTGISDLAGSLLIASSNKKKPWFDASDEGFADLVLRSAFSFMASLVIHPKRKCDLPGDHLTRIEEIKKNKKELFEGESHARKLALKTIQSTPPALKKHSPLVLYMAAVYAGQILGRQVYLSILEAKLAPDKVRREFFNPAKSSIKKLETLKKLASQVRLQESKAEIF